MLSIADSTRLQQYQPDFGPEISVSHEDVFRVLGVDFGQAGNFAAATMLEREDNNSKFCGPKDPYLRCKFLRQWLLGTSYWTICNDVIDLNPHVIVPDFTGVGRGVVDMLRGIAVQRGYVGRVVPVSVTDSRSMPREHQEALGKYVTIPKTVLMTAIRLYGSAYPKTVGGKAVLKRGEAGEEVPVMQSFLVFPDAKAEPTMALLEVQLRDFQMRYTSNARIVMSGKETGSGQDDLVIALGLACWFMQQARGRSDGPAIVC